MIYFFIFSTKFGVQNQMPDNGFSDASSGIRHLESAISSIQNPASGIFPLSIHRLYRGASSGICRAPSAIQTTIHLLSAICHPVIGPLLSAPLFSCIFLMKFV